MPNSMCEHGAPRGGSCRACEEETPEGMTSELVEAVWRTLYHHPYGSVVIVELLTGRRFDTPPPTPTDEQERMAHDIVEELLRAHYTALNGAMEEVLGEGLKDNPYI